jgi:hypothetical protein
MSAPDWLHMESFAGFVSFNASNPDCLRAFCDETGTTLSPPRSPLEAMIDKATGYQRGIAVKFIEWCAEAYGKDCLPPDYLEQVLKPTGDAPAN